MIHRESVVIDDIEHDERIPIDVYRPTFVRSLAIVPIRRLDPIGAIGNYWAGHHHASAHELALLQALADSTAVALSNVNAYQELEAARLETLNRLALAAEFRDDETHAHTQRVARTAELVAERIGLPGEEVAQIRLAAPLHDIGKLGIADAILLKPGRLTAAEFEVVKTHAAVGASLLRDSASAVLRLAGEIALSHHERWDGGGYPGKLCGESIPLSGRIVAVADVFDALTHERPYKPAWSHADAMAEIRRVAGAHLDPALVDVFARLDGLSLPH
jgi:HD-GYP domain-containing protein (c-di-GMP phosphodiesterase class II)